MSPGNRGLTLAETVVAIFLVVCGLLVSFQLLHLSLQYSTRVEHQVIASQIAESRIAEVRAWARARVGGRFNFDANAAWNAYNFGWTPDGQNPQYSVRMSNALVPLDTPCTALEAGYPPAQRKTMTRSFRKVQVEVAWGPGAWDQILLVTLVGAPERQPQQLTVDFPDGTPAAPIPRNSTVKLRARLLDTDGQPIPDVMFGYYARSLPGVDPATGSGTYGGNGILDSTHPDTRRDGSTTVFRHAYPGYGRNWIYCEGRVRVDGVARYRGVQFETGSEIFETQ